MPPLWGDFLPRAGGFLTVRQKAESGRAVACHIQRPDGSCREMILNYFQKPYTMHMEVFEHLGVQLLEEAKQCPYVVLDECSQFDPEALRLAQQWTEKYVKL